MSQQELEDCVHQAIKDKVIPALDILLARRERVIYRQVFGRESPQENDRCLQPDSIFDLASLTKPLATTFAILHLLDQQKLKLTTRVQNLIEETPPDKTEITIQHLLTHTSGLPAWSPLYEPNFDREQGWQKLLKIELEQPIGSKMVYSCLGFIILGEIIRRLSGQSLSAYCAKFLFRPLGLQDTMFNPTINNRRIIPTKKGSRGIVHDTNARLFAGEGGNAGLFSTATDILRLCNLIFKRGAVKGKQLISGRSINLLLQNHNQSGLTPHSLGWDYNPVKAKYKSCGDLMPASSIGHLGFTGTSLWIDHQAEICILLLSNRVYYGDEHKIEEMRKLRSKIHNLLYAMIDSIPLNA